MHGPGTQVIARSAALLTAIRRSGHAGARLVDVAGDVGLTTSTAHRLLSDLARVGFVVKIARRYHLGPALFELGVAAVSPLGPLQRYRMLLQDLATSTGDTVYLAIRRGDEVFYIMRAEGYFPIRTPMISPGGVLALVDGFAGIALLGAMPPEEAEQLLDAAYGSTAPPLIPRPNMERMLMQFRSESYVYIERLRMPEVSGLATVVPNRSGSPYVALTLAARPERLPEGRAFELREPLLACAAAIGRLIEPDPE